MKKLFVLFILSFAFSAFIYAADNTPKIEDHHEAFVIVGMSPEEIDSPAEGEQTEYSFTLTCPGCYNLMSAKFKKGYTSTTTTKCQKCGRKYIISYNWPGDHREPTIREVKETR